MKDNKYFDRKEKHFTLAELCKSETASKWKIDNTPTILAKENLSNLCANVLEPLRHAMGYPIKIGSGYRCARLNSLVGGVKNSQHMTGQAVDLCIEGDMNKAYTWFAWIEKNCEFDQLILEHNKKGSYWVHVSYSTTKNRKQVIRNLLKK